MTTTHDAQRAMKIFFKSELDEHDRKEWFAITGQYDLTTKVLWDTIRASESVAGFSGLGAAAQEPRCEHCAVGVPLGKETTSGHFRDGDFVGWCKKSEIYREAAAQEQPVENSRTYEQGVRDAEQREIKAIREGYKAEICSGCDTVLLAHKHFVACQKSDCPMKDGKGSVLEQLLLNSPQKGKP